MTTITFGLEDIVRLQAKMDAGRLQRLDLSWGPTGRWTGFEFTTLDGMRYGATGFTDSDGCLHVSTLWYRKPGSSWKRFGWDDPPAYVIGAREPPDA